jgi:hypothetical protein
MAVKTLVCALILCLLATSGFGLSVPSEDSTAGQPALEPRSGGMSEEQQIILIVVGAVCGTILLLAILD